MNIDYLEIQKKLIEIGGTVYNRALDVLFPPVCLSCASSIARQHDFLCRACFDKLVINTSLVCPACGARRQGEKLCHQTPYTLAPACMYHEPIPQLIHAYKYQKLEYVHTILSALLIVHIKRAIPNVSDCVVSYVPLHPRKERERGFNQSRLLAETIARHFQIPYMTTLQRTRFTEPQAQQKEHTKRFENVRNCFLCTDPSLVREKNILLVDDVSTSGATLLEASRALREHRPRKIIALVVAKAE